MKNEKCSPLISVVMTLFRHDDSLSLAIESVLAQTFQNFEIVLVDNNSSDKCKEIANLYLHRYPDRIRIVKESTQGIASSRNRGILESHGEYIAFLDTDDLMSPPRLEKQLKVCLENPEYSIITSLFDYLSYDGMRTEESNCAPTPQFWETLLFGHSEEFKIHKRYIPHPSTMFFKKSIAVNIGLFDTRFNPYWCEDGEFSLRMYEKGPFFLINESLTKIRLGTAESLKKRQKSDIDWVSLENYDKLYKILLNRYFNPNDRKIKKGFRKISARWLREKSVLLLQNGQGLSFGRRFLIRSLLVDPWNLKTWKNLVRAFMPRELHPKLFHFERIVVNSLPDFINKDFVENAFLYKKDSCKGF